MQFLVFSITVSSIKWNLMLFSVDRRNSFSNLDWMMK